MTHTASAPPWAALPAGAGVQIKGRLEAVNVTWTNLRAGLNLVSVAGGSAWLHSNTFVNNSLPVPAINAATGTAVVLEGNTTITNSTCSSTGLTAGIYMYNATFTALGPVSFEYLSGNCSTLALSQSLGSATFAAPVVIRHNRGNSATSRLMGVSTQTVGASASVQTFASDLTIENNTLANALTFMAGGMWMCISSNCSVGGALRVVGNSAPAGVGAGVVVVGSNSGSASRLTVQGPATFQGNAVARFSPGLYVGEWGSVRLMGDVVFDSNTGSPGGAMVATGGAAYFGGDLELVNNTGNGQAGGLAAQGPVTVAGQLTVVNNTARAGFGGGVQFNNPGANLTVLGDALFEGNSAAQQGAGLYLQADTVRFAGATTFIGNQGSTSTASSGGGAHCQNSNGTLRLEGPATFQGNVAGGAGGGLWCSCRLYIGTSLTVVNNTARGDGGGVLFTFTSAVAGSDPWTVGPGTGAAPVMINITGNRVTGSGSAGGGMHIICGAVTANYSLFARPGGSNASVALVVDGNTAERTGGGGVAMMVYNKCTLGLSATATWSGNSGLGSSTAGGPAWKGGGLVHQYDTNLSGGAGGQPQYHQ